MSYVKIYDAGELSPLTDVVLLSDHNKALFDREKLISKQAKRIAELESIPHTDNTAVIDKLQNHIKELEEKLAMKLDPALHPTCADCDKCSVVVSKMETTQKWISVKDRLPEEEKPYLIYIKGHKGVGDEQMIVYWDESRRDFCVGEEGCPIDDEYSEVTHWQPLPPPPTTEEK